MLSTINNKNTIFMPLRSEAIIIHRNGGMPKCRCLSTAHLLYTAAFIAQRNYFHFFFFFISHCRIRIESGCQKSIDRVHLNRAHYVHKAFWYRTTIIKRSSERYRGTMFAVSYKPIVSQNKNPRPVKLNWSNARYNVLLLILTGT